MPSSGVSLYGWKIRADRWQNDPLVGGEIKLDAQQGVARWDGPFEADLALAQDLAAGVLLDVEHLFPGRKLKSGSIMNPFIDFR